MNKSSVGFVSLSLLLIFTGIFILMSTFVNRNVERYFFVIAPFSLIVLGSEILCSSFKLKDKENMKISGLSVCICLAFAAFSLVFYYR